MTNIHSAQRLNEKSLLHSIQVELQHGYNLSPVEAQALARRVHELVDEQKGFNRDPGQITYQAIAIDEGAGKPLRKCRKVPVHLTLQAEGDAAIWARDGSEALRRLRVHRITYEALLQGGALCQEDVACILGLSLRTIKRIFAFFRRKEQPLPSRGELQDMGAGVSHKVPVIAKYVRDLSFSRISWELGRHGIPSMVRYLRHFALVMILEDRGLTPAQMQSVVGISENLIQQYRTLYIDLNTPEHSHTLQRLKRSILTADTTDRSEETPQSAGPKKRGMP